MSAPSTNISRDQQALTTFAKVQGGARTCRRVRVARSIWATAACRGSQPKVTTMTVTPTRDLEDAAFASLKAKLKPADVVAATATAIEQGLVRSIQSAYDALRALGYTDEHAERELVHTCRDGIVELERQP